MFFQLKVRELAKKFCTVIESGLGQIPKEFSVNWTKVNLKKQTVHCFNNSEFFLPYSNVIINL